MCVDVPAAVLRDAGTGARRAVDHDVRDQVDGELDADRAAISTRHLVEHFEWLKAHGYVPVVSTRCSPHAMVALRCLRARCC